MKKTQYLLFATLLLLATACGSDDEYSPSDNEDTERPSQVINVIASNITETSLELSWDAATDNVGVTGYKVFQDGLEINGNVSGTSYSVSELSAETNYTYYIIAFDAAGNQSQASNSIDAMTIEEPFGFRTNLSEMNLFTTTMADLEPASGVQLYELNTTLFTDYTTKQRLIKLPENGKLQYNGDDLLPSYPDETLIAKTFYYNIDDRDPSLGKKIIETRIFLKIDGIWEVGDYIWNESQTEATYTENGSEINISYIDTEGVTQDVEYLIPSKQDCFTCHNNNTITMPIGMKLRSMNFTPSYVGQNQLDFFISNGLLEGLASSNGIGTLADWTDTNLDINDRGRAYLDMNCAHCHNPNSASAGVSGMDLRLETPYPDTNIYQKRDGIQIRFGSTLEGYRMPVLGRTVVHEEAFTMLMEYLGQVTVP
ncbi:fibronectin type III domain-containing protein [Jejudonia soesokkakensis]|uniref:Fibronectin type III domain-containing protein n=1 Tax=Jejudonia soesokkakensis TaxID=1323432 RepID=A0ABW2MSP8_9FLAO